MSGNFTPVVSIIAPTCNRAKLLKKMVDSVLTQSYQLWELIVVDDISTDNTDSMMKEYSDMDSRIKYFRIPVDKEPGITKYLNFGLNISQGKYISRLDDDDYWMDDDVLKTEVEFLDTHPEYLVVGGAAIIVNEKGDHLFKYTKCEKDEDIRNNALMANPFVHTTAMFRKDVVMSIGGYENLPYAEDWDLWLKLGKIGKMYNYQTHFTCYLSAGQNTSFIKQRPQSKEILKIIRKYRKDYPKYWKGFFLNFTQYIYSFLPNGFKRRLQPFMIFLKRNYF